MSPQSNGNTHEGAGQRSLYPNVYGGLQLIKRQIMMIASILGLEPSQALLYMQNLPGLPTQAEGWFAIPSNEGLKRLFPEITGSADRYCAGVRLIHEKIAHRTEFHNWYGGAITPDRLKVRDRSEIAFELLSLEQPGDILIVAAQLGERYRGRSLNEARRLFKGVEFGLGSFAVGSIILTHLDHLPRRSVTDMGCAGDEFIDSSYGGLFNAAPAYYFDGDRVRCSAYINDLAEDDFGWVTAFPPKL